MAQWVKELIFGPVDLRLISMAFPVESTDSSKSFSNPDMCTSVEVASVRPHKHRTYVSVKTLEMSSLVDEKQQ